MNKLFLLLLMVFCHIVDDYYLQGWLASGKQKSWWEKNAPHDKYKNDYLMALFMHSFSWTFMIMLPIAYFVYGFNIDMWFILYFLFNLAMHFKTDDRKANKKEINLIQDQSIHLCQVIWTWICLVLL